MIHRRALASPNGAPWQIHEDNDILGRMTPEVYTWTTPGKGLVMIGTFVATVFSLCGAVYMFYPDKVAVPRTYPHGGLEKALGGPKVWKVGFALLEDTLDD